MVYGATTYALHIIIIVLSDLQVAAYFPFCKPAGTAKFNAKFALKV